MRTASGPLGSGCTTPRAATRASRHSSPTSASMLPSKLSCMGSSGGVPGADAGLVVSAASCFTARLVATVARRTVERLSVLPVKWAKRAVARA